MRVIKGAERQLSFFTFLEICPRRRTNKMTGKASLRVVRTTLTLYGSLQAADRPYILLPMNYKPYCQAYLRSSYEPLSCARFAAQLATPPLTRRKRQLHAFLAGVELCLKLQLCALCQFLSHLTAEVSGR